MTLLTVFLVGTAASLSLCAVVRLPIVLAYVAGAANSKRHGVVLSILFAVGLTVGTVLLGFTAGPPDEGLRAMLGLNKALFWLLGAGLFITGVLLSGVINPHLLPAKWQKAAQRLGRTGSTGALLLGCAFGLLQTPACPTCGNAVQALVQTAGERSSFGGILLFAGFAAGQGLMMLAVGVLTSLIVPELLRRLRTKMCSIEQRIQLLAGNVLMILGIYFIIVG